MSDENIQRETQQRAMSAYDLVQQQSQFYQTALEAHRVYVLQQIDILRQSISQGVTKEELKERLNALRKSFEVDVERVQTNIIGVSTHLDRMEQNILTQMATVHRQQATLQAQWEDRQKNSLKRIITIQATILMFILTSTIALVLNFIFHFIGAK